MQGWKWRSASVGFITALNKQPHWYSCELSLKSSIHSLINVWPDIKHEYIYFAVIRYSLLLDVSCQTSLFTMWPIFCSPSPQNKNRQSRKKRYQEQNISNVSLVHVIISKVADNYAVRNVLRSQNDYSSYQKSFNFLHASPHFEEVAFYFRHIVDRCFILEELFNKHPFFSGKSWSFDQIVFLSPLQLIHPHVIDTSLLYRREFGQRFKLKVLAETVLRWVLPLSLSPSLSLTHPPPLLI